MQVGWYHSIIYRLENYAKKRLEKRPHIREMKDSYALFVSLLIWCWRDAGTIQSCLDSLRDREVERTWNCTWKYLLWKQASKQTDKQNIQGKIRVARDNGLFHLFTKCACGNAIYFVPVGTSTYCMEQSKTLIMNVSAGAHAQLSNIQHAKIHLKVPNGRNS